VDEDGAVGEFQRRQLVGAGLGFEILPRPPAEKWKRIAVTRDHLLVVDSILAKGFLDAPTGVDSRSPFVAVTDIEHR